MVKSNGCGNEEEDCRPCPAGGTGAGLSPAPPGSAGGSELRSGRSSRNACPPGVPPAAGVRLAPLPSPAGEEVTGDCAFQCEIHTYFI